MRRLSAILSFVIFMSVMPAVSAEDPIFTEITRQAGIIWRQFSGESPDRLLIETMGGGVAFLDFDGDGLQDIFLVNGGETPLGKSSTPVRNALYRNLGNGRFDDVAAKSGVDRTDFYGTGVTAGDFDNDGFPDLFVTGFPACALFHNNRNGTFTNITEHSGVTNPGRWAASAAWIDYDRDGYLDLVVTNYVEFSFDHPKKCEVNGVRSYCEQLAYSGMPLSLFHNHRDGTFTDASAVSGVGKLTGRALGVAAIDANGDGWTDLFVARDASPNLLLINQKNGMFKDTGNDAEVAYDQNGFAKAGMGVDAGDINGDGYPDFVVTNFNDQYHSLFEASKAGLFTDRTVASHLAAMTKNYVGWGTKFLDFDNDGSLDIVFINGHINPVIETTRAGVKYQEPPLLLRNDSHGNFGNFAIRAGTAFGERYVGRGLAIGDIDNDGYPDLIFTRLNQTPVLLRNNAGSRNSWIGFELQGTVSNRDAVGARVVVSQGESQLVRWITSGSSYLSSHDKRLLFGLGNLPIGRNVSAEITWPNGQVQRLPALQVGRYHKIAEPQP